MMEEKEVMAIQTEAVEDMEIMPGDSSVDQGGNWNMDGKEMAINDPSMNGIAGTEIPVTDRLMSSVPFLCGTGALALALGIVCGLLLAKKKIKKGIGLYED